MSISRSENRMRIIIIHPDLGIGGAERLIVDIAKGMKALGHDIRLYTSHHDPSRCFEETTGDGIIAGFIEVHGSWIPRQIFGRCTALCAMIRMIYVSLVAIFGHFFGKFRPTLIFIDSVSAPIPLFLLCGIPSMFYCHFPDKLLCVERGNSLKKLYRLLIDNFEECSTGCANEIVVNSKFTAEVFSQNFHYLGKSYKPQVLYPTIELPKVVDKPTALASIPYAKGFDVIFTSLNRYERKKNIPLAIEAFDALMREARSATATVNRRALLVIAGGYDSRVTENVEHLDELVTLAKKCGDDIAKNIVFRQSISDSERNALLTYSTAILYTPANEHFGIVPIEAMGRGTPVIAVRSGGPLETVLHDRTGFLCDASPESFMQAMKQLLLDDNLALELGHCGRQHTESKFSFEAMVPQLESYLQSTVKSMNRSIKREKRFLLPLLLVLGSTAILFVAIALRFSY